MTDLFFYTSICFYIYLLMIMSINMIIFCIIIFYIAFIYFVIIIYILEGRDELPNADQLLLISILRYWCLILRHTQDIDD